MPAELNEQSEHMPSLLDKIALVTGGGTGIGRATALEFAKQGALVIVANRHLETGKATVEAIVEAGGQADAFATDITDASQVEALIDQIVANFGRLDIAFNNAGNFGKVALLSEQKSDDFAQVFAVNVQGTFHCMKYELAVMQQQGYGIIVNNASTSGIRNFTLGVSPYAAAKSAVVSLTKSAALEYAATGIRINAIVPGRVETAMLRTAGQGDVTHFADVVPMQRLGQPEEVAQAVTWLASEQASFVTGHLLAVDGGILAG